MPAETDDAPRYVCYILHPQLYNIYKVLSATVLYVPFTERHHCERIYIYILYMYTCILYIPVRYNTSPWYAVRVDNSWKYKFLRESNISPPIPTIRAHMLLKALLITIIKYPWPSPVCENRLTADTKTYNVLYM